MELKYGQGSIKLSLESKNILEILLLGEVRFLLKPEDKLKNLLKNPIGSFSLKELILQKRAKIY